VNEDKSTRYNRLKRTTSVCSVAWGVAFLGALLLSGGSTVLRSAAERMAAAIAPASVSGSATVVLFVALLMLLNEAGSLPLAFYGGYVLERRYGLSQQPLGAWARDQAKALLLGVVFGAVAAVILYALIARFPGYWWLPASVVFSLIVVGLANVAPVLLLPLFYRLTPLKRESLRARLLALADRAGARVLDVYEWGLGEKTSKANAALTGIGATRRILVSDTMLAHYSDDEIEVVLAHELAHHVYGDIWKGLVFETGLIVAGFLVASIVLQGSVGVFGFRGIGDVAALPVLVLAAGAVSLVAVPAAHAMSRAHERRADRFALTLTRNAPAFVSAMRRLAAQNMAEDEPSQLVQWLFHSHPPIRERIAAAQAFRG
jgi:STE24 endopeptidase